MSTNSTPALQRLAVSAAFLANGFVVGSWATQIPVFAERLAISEAVLGLLILAFGVGAVLAMPLVGRWIGAAGSRLPMLALHLAMAAALPFVAFAPSLTAATLAVAFAGITIGGMDVAMNANAVFVEQRRPSAIMSSCHGFWSVGGLIGAGIGGSLIALLGAGVHALLVGAVVLLLAAAVARFAAEDRDPSRPGVPVVPAIGMPTSLAAPPEAAPSPSLAPGSGGLLKALAIGLFALAAMIPEGAAIDWSALYLRQELGASAEMSGLAFAAFSATMAVLRFAGDGIRDRLGAVTTVRLCSVAGAAGLLAIGFAETTTIALAGFALMGIGLSNIVPIAFSAAGNLPGLKPGAGLSTVTAMGYSGILVAPSAIGFIAEHTGFAPIFAGLAVLLAGVFLAAPIVAGADRPAP